MPASAIVLAYGAEPDLADCVGALVDSSAQEVLVVDNGADPGAISAVRGLPRVRVLTPGRNLGFAGGCNAAAAQATGDILVFVNSDAVVQPGAVEALAERVADPEVGLACGSIRLAGDPTLLNTAGNPVHYLMFSWVGGLGEPADPSATAAEVASITGVAFAARRAVWQELGGFDEDYFAYCEDVYLSIRAWHAGYRVVSEPRAIVLHRYDFARNPRKRYLLERNRLMNLVLLPERRTRRLVSVPAAVVEVGVLLVAVREGWAGEKIAGWRWLVARREVLKARRRDIQAGRVVADREVARHLRGALDPPPGLGPAVPGVVSTALERYWRWVVPRL